MALRFFNLSMLLAYLLSPSNEFHGLFMLAGKKHLINILVGLNLLPELEMMYFGYLAVVWLPLKWEEDMLSHSRENYFVLFHKQNLGFLVVTM